MKTKEEKRNQQPSPPTIRTPLPYRNMSHMQGNNNRNGNGKETGMENQRGKDTGMQDNPTIPTLSDQKKPPFPAERKKHPQTTRKKEEQTFSLLPKGESLPSPTGNDFSLSLLLKKRPIAEVQKDSPPSCQKPCIIFPTAKRTPFPAAEKTTSLSPPLKTK
jgi:hypothetical protein